MTTIIDKGYRCTPEQIEHMARDAAKGYDATGTYLRCLIVAASDSRKRGIKAVDEAHDAFYPAVLRGVGGEGAEQNRRATFARSAASTLRAYIRKGGKLADINVHEATKGTLRAFGAPPESGDRVERSAARATDALLRALRRMAKRDLTEARRLVSEVVDSIREVVPARGRVPEGTRTVAVH